MKGPVVILPDEITCRSRSNNKVYQISQVCIVPRKVSKDTTERFYKPDTSFFKAVCCKGTSHYAEEHQIGCVTIY